MLKSKVSRIFSSAVSCYRRAFQRIHLLVFISYLLNIIVFTGYKIKKPAFFLLKAGPDNNIISSDYFAHRKKPQRNK
jgi:hypothetical protein